MRSSRAHTDEMLVHQKGPLAWNIYIATRNIVIFRDVPGAGEAAVDWKKTMEARAKIEAQVRREFAPQATPSTPELDKPNEQSAQGAQTTPDWLNRWKRK